MGFNSGFKGLIYSTISRTSSFKANLILMSLFTFWNPTWLFYSGFSNNIFYALFISPTHISLLLNHHYICHRNLIWWRTKKLILPHCATYAMFSSFDHKRRLLQYWPTTSVYKFYDCSTLSKHRHSSNVTSTGMSKPYRLVNVGWRLQVSFFPTSLGSSNHIKDCSLSSLHQWRGSNISEDLNLA